MQNLQLSLNPPYIPGRTAFSAPEVKHEPRLALNGGFMDWMPTGRSGMHEFIGIPGLWRLKSVKTRPNVLQK